MKATPLFDSLKTVTTKWDRHCRAHERGSRASYRRASDKGIRDAVFERLPEAWAKASGRAGMATARSLFYAVRPLVEAELGTDTLRGDYFSKRLLPDYLMEFEPDWDVLWDARGHMHEPHTGITVGLGTAEVRDYIATMDEDGTGEKGEKTTTFTRYPTAGPKHRYTTCLFVEKEGFMPLFERVKLAERYDLAIMCTKGMSPVAARRLAEEMEAQGVKVLVAHDLDKSGFVIFGSLRGPTQRWPRELSVIDIGLHLEDAEAMGLASEGTSVNKKSYDCLIRNGATEAEAEFLCSGKRIELNAMTSDQLIEWLEQKLVENGAGKVVPDETTLRDAYRRQVEADLMAAALNEVRDSISIAAEAVVNSCTAGLADEVETMLAAEPTLAWDEAVARLAGR